MKTAEEILKEIVLRDEDNPYLLPTEYELVCNKIKYRMIYDELVIEAMKAFANQSKWISVAENHPELGEKVLVLFNNGSVQTASFVNNTAGNEWYLFELQINIYETANKLTHWQELPCFPEKLR